MRTLSANWRVVFGIVLAIAILPLITYWLKFGTFYLSSDFSEWVNFSSYWSPFLVTALTVILAYISWQSLELMKLKEKPFLVVERVQVRIHFRGLTEQWDWKIKNIGAGPALDVRLFILPKKPISGVDNFLKEKKLFNEHLIPDRKIDYEYFVHGISLSSGQELNIGWHPDLEKLSVVYSDLHGKRYAITYLKFGLSDSDHRVLQIDLQGMEKENVLFSRGQDVDKNLGPKRIFTIGECFIQKEIEI